MKIKNVDTETEKGLSEFYTHMETDSPLFQELEKQFDEWIEHVSSNDKTIYEMYFSEDAIFYKEGAIRGAIEHIFEVMDDYELKHIMLDDTRLDFQAVWQ